MQNDLNYAYREIDGIKIVDLTGSLTSATVDVINEKIKTASEKESLIINLVNVKLVTTTGLNFLVEASILCKGFGRRIIILWPSDDFLQMVDQLDLHEFLTFADSIEEGRMKIMHYT